MHGSWREGRPSLRQLADGSCYWPSRTRLRSGLSTTRPALSVGHFLLYDLKDNFLPHNKENNFVDKWRLAPG